MIQFVEQKFGTNWLVLRGFSSTEYFLCKESIFRRYEERHGGECKNSEAEKFSTLHEFEFNLFKNGLNCFSVVLACNLALNI